MNFTAKPERTYALVVGIEKYQEKAWNVTAPAMDALKFGHWLIQRGVPKANIRLCLSYLKEHQDLFSQADLEIEPATEANIFAIITDFLSQQPGDLLYIFWAGHGLITSERERRLLSADITKQNWQNIDLNSLLLFLNSDTFAISNHVVIIDACANYLVESAGRPTNLGGRIFSNGKPRTESQQFILLATREGEKAKVNPQERTGYFSQAVREALEQEPPNIWPPDMLKVADKVKQQFASLDKQQLPTYYFHQNWDGDKHSENPFTKLITPQNIPRSSVIKFVGRETALTDLHQKLQQRERVAITAIAGMGGVGKTELALQYASHYWEQGTYPGGVCWLRVRNEDIGTQILQFAINQLGLKPPEDFDLKAQIDYCWRVWQDGDVLIIVDDVIKYEQIQDYLPPSLPKFKFRVLVTTRIQQLQESFQNLDLGVLDETAALELLISFIGEERIYREIDAAKQLCADLGYLPLGLELVARYLQRKQDLSLVEMRERLAEKRLQHRSLQKPSAEMTAKLGVQAAFELSWQELNNEAQKLACLLSIFAIAPIPWHLVERCLPDADAEDLEDLRDDFLVKLSLIQRTGTGIYQLHQLIREFLGDKREKLADVDELKRSFCQVMVEEAQEIPQTPNQEQIAAFTLTIPHLSEAATVQKNWLSDEDLILPFLGLSRFYEGQGAYQEALPWLEQCLSATRERLGESHPDIANSLNNLALLYGSQGRYTEAESLHLQALQLRKHLLGESHPDVANSLNNLALLYGFQGRYTEAEPLFLQALQLRKRLLGESHPDVATSLNNLAALYGFQGRYIEAEPLFLQALQLKKRLLGESHPDVATSLNNLALLYGFQGRYTEAEPLYVQALKLRKRLLGESHPDVAQSLNNLALLYRSQGRYTDAEPLYIKALEIAEQRLGVDHPNTITIRNNLQYLRDNYKP
ncbi:tetratricopeptide repeat protein [Anabaena variabilis FACHB-164]|nr:tetratricopeptide repeat protein [Trichormus variabilis FACHB-164]